MKENERRNSKGVQARSKGDKGNTEGTADYGDKGHAEDKTDKGDIGVHKKTENEKGGKQKKEEKKKL